MKIIILTVFLLYGLIYPLHLNAYMYPDESCEQPIKDALDDVKDTAEDDYDDINDKFDDAIDKYKEYNDELEKELEVTKKIVAVEKVIYKKLKMIELYSEKMKQAKNIDISALLNLIDRLQHCEKNKNGKK